MAVPEAGLPLARPTDALPTAQAKAPAPAVDRSPQASANGSTVEGSLAIGLTAQGSPAAESPAAGSTTIGSTAGTDAQPR
ncbi:MAG TPA: hypothetical protein VEO91_01705, partial [Candidatus Limnocylindria bacterium]|nr:hypothetical protein [Candidatus Limnocylindria bacterium]